MSTLLLGTIQSHKTNDDDNNNNNNLKKTDKINTNRVRVFVFCNANSSRQQHQTILFLAIVSALVIFYISQILSSKAIGDIHDVILFTR
jgi:hypothetical protein